MNRHQSYQEYLQICREYEERPLSLADWQKEQKSVQQLPPEPLLNDNREPARDYSIFYTDSDFTEWAEL